MPTEPLGDYCHACGMTEVCRDSDDDCVRIKPTLWVCGLCMHSCIL